MPRITNEEPFDGFHEKALRLGLGSIVEEVRTTVTGFQLRVAERKDANGAAVLREMIDTRFKKAGGWEKRASGSADWTKVKAVNGTRLCVKVEVQVSARSDLLIRDVVHLRDALEKRRPLRRP